MMETKFTDLPANLIGKITGGMSDVHRTQLSVMHSKLAATVRYHHSPNLLRAAAEANEEQLAGQLRLGANPNARNEYGRSALELTLLNVNVACAWLLISKGAVPTKHDLDALVRSCSSEPVMRRGLSLLIHGVHQWLRQPHMQKARLDPNHPDCLRILLYKNFLAAAADLVEAGVTKESLDATLQLSVRTTAFRVSSIEFLLARGADPRGPGLVAAAVRSFSPDVLKVLLEAGAPVEQDLPSESTTPLAAAVARNSAECVKLLIEHGADVTSSGAFRGFLPLVSFVRSRGMLHLLRSHNAPMESRLDLTAYSGRRVLGGEHPHGWTPMHVFAFRNRAHIIHEMVGMGLDVNGATPPSAPDQPQTRTSPLELAVIAGAYEAVMILLQAGADTGRGEAPLLQRADEALQRAQTPAEQYRCSRVRHVLQERIPVV